MAYVEKADLKGLIPDEYLDEALDDDQSGLPDNGSWAGVAAAVADEIDGRLAARYATPVTPVPALIRAAAKVFALAILYRRRGSDDKTNPWAEQEKTWKDRLDKIGSGDEPLTHDAAAAVPSGSVISESSKTFEGSGRLMV